MTAQIRTARRRPAALLGADISEARTLDDALALADLDWTITDVAADNVSVITDDGITPTSIPGHRLLMRSDNHTTLGVVGNRYTSVDNRQAFQLADAAVDLGAKFAHAGETDHGRKTFLTMTLPEASVYVGGHDLVSFDLIFKASHDGSSSIIGEVQGTRLVCENGMRVNLNAGHRWAIRHTRSADSALVAARAALQRGVAYAKEFAAHADALITTSFSLREFNNLITTLYPEPEEHDSARKHTTWQNRRTDLFDLYRAADTQEEGRHTAWAAFNAVVEYDEWYRPSRNGQEGRALRNFTNPDNSGVVGRAFELLTA